MKRLYHISVLRIFCILVVVFFHCYGMMYAGHFPDTVSQYKEIYFDINQYGFINVAMPLFVFISGYLFIYLLKLGKYPTWGNLLRKKGARILVPYFVFGLFFMATTGNWHPLNLLTGSYWHLWFLPMLFGCFLVGYIEYKIKLSGFWNIVLLSLLFIVSFMPESIPSVLGMKEYLYWFYLGMMSYRYRNALSEFLTQVNLSWGLLLVSCVVIYMFPVKYGDSTWYGNLAVTACILVVSCWTGKVDWSKFKLTPYLVKFSSYSFGVYIWHNWVALMLISKTSQRIFGLPELAANHVVLFPLCFSLITLVISWFLSWCMMKTKIGKFLIG